MNAKPEFEPSRFRCVGMDDSADTCACCGKTGLKRVVWLFDTHSTDDAAPYGTTCAALLLLGRKVTRRESERLVDATVAAEIERIADRYRDAPPPAMRETTNRYGVACWTFDDGTELAACGLPWSEIAPERKRVSRERAIVEWREREATAHARAVIRGFDGRVRIGDYVPSRNPHHA